MDEVLSGQELAWWNRFSNEATPLTTRRVYQKHCRLYGTPEPGSARDTVVSIAGSSAEFWPGDPRITGPQAAPSGFWKRLLRFTVAVGADALGAAAASETGPAGAAVVGGLVSVGADRVIFGCGCGSNGSGAPVAVSRAGGR